MKKFCLIVFLVLGLASTADAQLRFRGIPLNRPMDSVISGLAKLGYRLISEQGTTALMKGSFSGRDDCTIGILATPQSHTVWKVVVFLPERDNWTMLKNEYYLFKESLGNKYPPEVAYEFFSKPYYEGDGYELQAIRMDKCSYLASFNAEGGVVYIEIKQGNIDPYLAIVYEDARAATVQDEEKLKTVEKDL